MRSQKNYRAWKFLVFNSGHKSINNWLFKNSTIEDKNVDEGDIYRTALSPINGIKFKNSNIGGVKVISLTEANMDKNNFTTNIKFGQ